MTHELYMLSQSVMVQFLELLPYWASGLIVGSLISVYCSERIAAKMTHLNSGKVGILSIGIASILGILSPICMYGTIPVIAALGRKKVPQQLLVAFMVSSVLLNPNLFLLSFALGVEIALSRLLLVFMCGSLAGVLVLIFLQYKTLFDFARFVSESKEKKTFLRDLFKAFRVTTPYLLFGIILTALLYRYMPQEWIASMFGARRGLGVLFATSLSIPLYACGGGIIPLIRAWLLAGMGTGDALAFMIAGPATKITNLSAVKMILGAKHFFFYLAYCMIFAIVAGLIM
ncbi:MAG: permease [Oscillospiraceae bacterium]|nr:permease [Oscillospiraceae bacterium]